MANTDSKDQLISSILDELKELEMLTRGMQHPEVLQELALKKAQALVVRYEELKKCTGDAVAEKPEVAKAASAPILEKEEVAPVVATTAQVQPQPEAKKVVIEQPVAAAPVKAEPKAEAPKVAPQPQVQTTPENRWQQTATPTNNDRFMLGGNGGGKTLMENIYVKSLKSALTLNDKIRFSKELFNGDTAQMNATIDELDQMANMGDALSFINAKFSWDKDNEAVQEFLTLLGRRF